jgi:hypothetical protein
MIMQRNRTIIWSTLVVTLLSVFLIFMLPIPANWKLPRLEFYLPLASFGTMTCLHIGAAILFTTNLGVYKARLRRAYVALAVGIIMIALGTLQVAIISATNTWYSPWVLSGGLIMPFFVATLTVYLAMRHLAHLVGVRHLLTKLWFVLPVVLVISLLIALLPHVPVAVSASAYAITIGTTAWSGWMLFVTSMLVFVIRKHAGEHYSQAMAWLGVAIFIGFLDLTAQYTYNITTVDYTSPLARAMNILSILSGLLWLRASYSFALTRELNQHIPLWQFLIGQNESSDTLVGTPIDMVTHAAGLASNVREIDPLLDNVRVITAKLQPGQSLSPQETTLVIRTYLKIENYLIHQEPIRTFTKQELRIRLAPDLRKAVTALDSTA